MTLNAFPTVPRPARNTLAALALLPFAMSSHAAPFAYITSYYDNTVSVVDVATQAVTKTIPVGTAPVGVVFTPDGSRAYVSNREVADHEGTLSVIDTATHSVVATLAVGGAPYSMVVTPDGSHLYLARHHARQIAVISTADNTVVANIPLDIKPFQLAITPDGSTVYATCQDICNVVTAISTATNTVVGTTTTSAGAQGGLDVTPDGKRLYVSSTVSNEVSVLSATTGALLKSIPMESTNSSVVVSPSGDKVYVATSTGKVAVVSTATDTVTSSFQAGSANGLRGLALTSDGSAAYAVDWNNNSVAVIDTASSTVKATVAVGRGPYSMGKFIQKQRYAIDGFFAPVDNAPAVNTMKAGAAVPMKFSLGGDKGLDILAANAPSSRQVH